jgi:hypothetical protein
MNQNENIDYEKLYNELTKELYGVIHTKVGINLFKKNLDIEEKNSVIVNTLNKFLDSKLTQVDILSGVMTFLSILTLLIFFSYIAVTFYRL